METTDKNYNNVWSKTKEQFNSLKVFSEVTLTKNICGPW